MSATDKPDLAALVERLRRVGLRVDTRQYLAAHQMLLSFAAHGTDLQSDPVKFASHLGPIFCASADDQAVFRAEFGAWAQDPSKRDDGVKSDPLRRSRSWILTAAVSAGALALVLAVLLVLWLLPTAVTQKTQTTTTTTTSVSQQPNRVTARPPGALQPNIRIGPAKVLASGDFANAPQETLTQRWLFSLSGGVACALALFVSVWSLRRRKRTFGLKRLAGADDPRLITLDPPAADVVDLATPQLLRIATGLRRPRAQTSAALSLEATIEATARAGGLFSPAFAPTIASPEYLVLIERRGPDDHTWHFMHRWVEQLSARDVAVDAYDFESDPRVCTDGKSLRRYRLPELLARYHRAVTIIHAETATLFDEFSGRPHPWLESIQGMRACVLLTLTPTYRWGQREAGLIRDGLIVLPASPAGLLVAAAMGNEWWQPPQLSSRYTREFPRIIGGESLRWLDRDPPPDRTIATLLQQVSGFLGPKGYLWLCACAVYPQISWPMTLALLQDIVPPEDTLGNKRAIEEYLPALSRLPWLRHGYMPDWLRSLLIARLPPDKEVAIRKRLGQLMFDLIEHEPGEVKPGHVGLEVAMARAPLDIARALPVGSPLRDRVFMGFLAGANPDPLTLNLPKATIHHPGPRERGLLERLVGWCRGFVALRPIAAGAVTALIVGALVVVGLLFALPPVATPVPPVAADTTHLFGQLARDGGVIAPNGAYLVIGDPLDNTRVTLIWDLVAAKAVAQLVTPGKVSALTVSPDSTLIAGYEAGGPVHVWSSTGQSVVDFKLEINKDTVVSSLSFSSDGKLLAVASSRVVVVYSVPDGQLVAKTILAPPDNLATGVDFGMQTSRVITTTRDDVEIFNLTPSGMVSTGAIKFANTQGLVAQSADGRYVALPDNVDAYAGKGLRIALFDAQRPTAAAKQTYFNRISAIATALAVSPRGEVIAFSDPSIQLMLVEMKSKKVLFDADTTSPDRSALYAVRFRSGSDPAKTYYDVIQRPVIAVQPPLPEAAKQIAEVNKAVGTAVKAAAPEAIKQLQKNIRAAKVPKESAAEAAAAPSLRAPYSPAPSSNAPAGTAQTPATQAPSSSAPAGTAQTPATQAPSSSAPADTAQTPANQAPSSNPRADTAQAPTTPTPSPSAPATSKVPTAPTGLAASLSVEPPAPTRKQESPSGEVLDSLFEQTHFILPRDARPNDKASIGPFCCDGYTAEISLKNGKVVGYLHLTTVLLRAEDRAMTVTVTASAARNIAAISTSTEPSQTPALGPKDFINSRPATFSVADFLKKRQIVLTADGLDFHVSIANAEWGPPGQTEPDLRSVLDARYFVISTLQVSVDVVSRRDSNPSSGAMKD